MRSPIIRVLLTVLLTLWVVVALATFVHDIASGRIRGFTDPAIIIGGIAGLVGGLIGGLMVYYEGKKARQAKT